MATQKQSYLHELLQEDQEPFLLKNYIEDRRCQLLINKTCHKKQQLSQKKHSNFPSSFCKKACFFAINVDSPDPRKSPLFNNNYQKSPIKTSPKSIFLNVPAKTSALLLEAAVRIQKNQNKATNNTSSSNLVGTLLKKLTLKTNKKNNKKKDISKAVSVKDSNVGQTKKSKSNSEENSFDFYDTTCSSCSCHSDQFCESPFRFVLLSPSPGHRTPEFSSPATSPLRPTLKDKENNFTVESLKKLQQEEQDEEEDKEQCSPVSVLDPPFEDDDDSHYHELHEDDDDDGYDIENSFAIVHRAKHNLLQKLRRFERLAELDPIELEKRMSEQLDDDEEEPESEFEDQDQDQDESFLLNRERNVNELVKDVLWESGFHHSRLVSDLIAEEEQRESMLDKEVIVSRVCERLELWKEVELNTIDMMVHLDFRSEVDDAWKKNQVQVGEVAKEIEFAIFGTLIEELII
ncbi:hypothetical protein ACFE04_000657 [Oxalis oulophora]